MRRIDLAGEWTVRKAGAKKYLPALVPGCIHADLLASIWEKKQITDDIKRGLMDAISAYAKTFA